MFVVNEACGVASIFKEKPGLRVYRICGDGLLWENLHMCCMCYKRLVLMLVCSKTCREGMSYMDACIYGGACMKGIIICVVYHKRGLC